MQTKFQRSRKFQQSGIRTPPVKMSTFQSKLLLLIETERRRSIKVREYFHQLIIRDW